MPASEDVSTGVDLVGLGGRADEETPVVEPEAYLLTVGTQHHVGLVVVEPTSGGRGEAGLKSGDPVTAAVVEGAISDVVSDDASDSVPMPGDGVATEIGASEELVELEEFGGLLLRHGDSSS